MKIYTYNEDYFEKIDSQEKAYWLGFIAADGYINKKGNTVGISLDSIDTGHLGKFLKAINSKNIKIIFHFGQYSKLHRFTEKARVEIYSKKMNSDLRKLGITINKSHDLKELKNIPDELIPHLIRGYLDGDGCVFESTTKKNGKEYMYPGFSFTGTENFLNFINNSLPFKVKKLFKDKRTPSSYTLYIKSLVRFRILYDYFYKESVINLDRKFIKAKFIIDKIQQRSTTKRGIPKAVS